MSKSLYLHEEILLLALRDEEGTLPFGSLFTFAAAGALLHELLLAGRATLVTRGRKKPLVELVDETHFDDEVLNEALAKLQKAKRRAKPFTWVSRFTRIRRLKHRIASVLCHKGILREDEGRLLLIFPRKIYPERDSGPERAIVARLERVIFGGAEPDARTRALIALAHKGELLKNVFDKKRLRRSRKRIERLIAGDVVAEAVKSLVEAMRSAGAGV